MTKKFLGMTACVFLMGLIACSGDSKTTGVTEDDNAIAQRESSSSGANSSSGPVAGPRFDLWNGADQLARVNVGNKAAGNWFNFNYGGAGTSNVIFPGGDGSNLSVEILEETVSLCDGVCGTVKLENLTSRPMAGVGFTVAEEDSTADISSWGGVCVTYESAMAITVALGVETDGDSINWASPFVTLPKSIKDILSLDQLLGSDKVVTRCAKWSDFKIPEWTNASENSQVGTVLSGEEAAKQVVAILFMFNGESSESGAFNIKGVSTYDENLPQWSEPVSVNDFVSSSSVNSSNSSSVKDVSACLWNGTKKEYFVNTGFDSNGEHHAGYWYSYDDNQDGGTSKIEWPEVCVNYYEDGCMESIIDYCNGICGWMDINMNLNSEAVLGVAFNVAGFENPDTDIIPMTADISDWGGICVTLKSELNLFMRLGLDSLTEVIIELGKTPELEEKCFTWDDFDKHSEGYQMPAKEAAKKVRNIKFGKRSGEDMAGTFTIVAIGKYSANGACGVDGVRSSSSRNQSSSSQIATSSSSQVAAASDSTCYFNVIDDFWYGPSGSVRVETGLDDGTATSGDWFKLQDRGSSENTKVIWPVELGDEYDDEAFKALVEYCGGVCATLDFRNAYFAGVGFHVAGSTKTGVLSTADATGWGGLCVTYASEGDVDVVLNKGDHDEFFKPNLLPTVTLPKSEEVSTQCVPWSGFKDVYDELADVTTLSSVYFLINGEDRTKSKINIVGLGKYKELPTALGQCREKDDFVSEGK